jgi:tetratricopeptide (TPR) repeat protein
VFAQYDESVRAMVAACQAARVPIVLVRLGSNLRDCPPFKSEHRAGLAPESEADWQAAFDLATAAEKSDPGRALQCYLDAAKIDGEHALLNFRIARVLDRIGRTREALTYYERARDEDICPLRIMSPLEKILSRIAADTRTPLIDAAALIAARTPDGIPGNDWYLDQVHPTIRGHQLIAEALAAEMRTRGFVAPSTTWADEQRRESYARQLAAVGPVYFADGRRRVAWLDQWSQRQRLAAEALPHDAASYARLCFRCLALGEDDAAWEALREALKRDASISDLVRRHAQEIAAGGRTDAAAALLRHLP